MGTIADIVVTEQNAERFWIVVHRDDAPSLRLTVDQDVLLQFRLKKGWRSATTCFNILCMPMR